MGKIMCLVLNRFKFNLLCTLTLSTFIALLSGCQPVKEVVESFEPSAKSSADTRLKPQQTVNSTATHAVDSTQLKRVALVIGNSKYLRSPLRNPINDATDMGESLRKLGFDVTVETDMSLQSMEKAVSTFGKKLGENTVGLFYYSGHGVQHKGENYLIPVDVRLTPSTIKYRAMAAGIILAEMEQANNTMNIIILDACRDTPFETDTRSMSRGLARMNAPSGSLIAYATSPGDTASDGSGKNSPYTRGLLQYLEQPGLTIEMLFKRVRNSVIDETGGKQVPWEHSSLKGADFYFAGEANSELPPEVLARLEELERLRIENEKQQAFIKDMLEKQRKNRELEEQRAAEQKRLNELARQQEEEKREAELARLAELERQRKEAEREAELARLTELERQRKEAEENVEKARLAELARQQEELRKQAELESQRRAEKARLTELQRQRDESARRKAEEARLAELQRQREEEAKRKEEEERLLAEQLQQLEKQAEKINEESEKIKGMRIFGGF